MTQLPQTGGSYRRDDDGALVRIEPPEEPDTEDEGEASTAESVETNETGTGVGKTPRKS